MPEASSKRAAKRGSARTSGTRSGSAGGGDAARHPLPEREAHGLQPLGPLPHRDLEDQVLLLLVDEEQRPVARAQHLAHLLHDEGEHLVDVEGAGQRPADVVEGLELLHLPLQLVQQVAGLHGRGSW